MGNWNMTIVGLGAHHNDDHPVDEVRQYDANYLFKRFLADLKEKGHKIDHASFTYGGSETYKC